MSFAIKWFLDRFGLLGTIVIGALLAAVLYLLLALAWSHLFGWWHARSNANLKADLGAAKAEIVVARHDEAQATHSAAITVATVAAQDKHLAETRAATTQTTEVIHERIRQVPVVVPVPSDPLVLLVVAKARERAQAAADRLSGTQGRRPTA